MAARTPPFVLQGGSHPAEHFRETLIGVMGSPFGAFAGGIQATTAGGGHGVAGATDLAVAQNGTPNMSVNVAGGTVFIRGTESQNQGVYVGYNDATLNVSIAAADPTNPRKDLIVAKVRDSFYSGASADFSIVAVTGTAAASPADPAVPANAVVLARVTVAALSTTVVNANIADLRTRASALGGMQICTSTTRPTGLSLYPGLSIFETDTLNEMFYTGSVWTQTGGFGSYKLWTPAFSFGLAATGIGTVAGRSIRLGRFVHFNALMNITAATNVGAFLMSLPYPAATTAWDAYPIGMATMNRAGTSYGGMLYVGAGGTSCTLSSMGTSPQAGVTGISPATWAANDYFRITGSYEAAAD